VKAGKTLLAAIEPTDPALLDVRAKAEAEARVKRTAAAVKQAQARVAAAREAEEMARHVYERAQRLWQTNSISREEFDNAEHKHALAKEGLRVAEFGTHIATFESEIAKAALLRTQPGAADANRLEIHSPIDGAVLHVFQESAGVVQSGTRILELGDPSDLEVEVDVLSSDAVKIRPGAKARLEHWGGDLPLLARVRLVEPAGFLKISALGVEEQRVYVILDLLDPLEKRKTLGDAYRVEARIVIWEGRDVLKTPAGALFRHEDSWAVFVVESGRAQVRPVRAGRGNGLETEILEGLQENERVIVHPSDKIRGGTSVVPR
jgi:HlyD family secretion protein